MYVRMLGPTYNGFPVMDQRKTASDDRIAPTADELPSTSDPYDLDLLELVSAEPRLLLYRVGDAYELCARIREWRHDPFHTPWCVWRPAEREGWANSDSFRDVGVIPAVFFPDNTLLAGHPKYFNPPSFSKLKGLV